LLKSVPGLRPVAIFDEIRRRHPEIGAGVRRTLERRIRSWRALNGAERGNFLLSQVFFELAREIPNRSSAPPLHALNIADILRHTRLSDGDRLADCFTAINQAFQSIRNDPEAALFGFDQYGHVYIHETTHRSIRWVWEQLVAAHSPATGSPATAGERAPAGFTPPHLGPSEEIAQHAPGPATISDRQCPVVSPTHLDFLFSRRIRQDVVEFLFLSKV
jgi:hypothetical protein